MFSLVVLGFLLMVIASIVFFVVSLLRYRAAKRKYRQLCDPAMGKELISRRVLLIVASVIMGVLLAVVIGLVVLFYMAIAFM